MKKRLIGSLLMGALVVSSTSVFVSCKDYDDDINNIVATKADKTALKETETALQKEISSLKTTLETVQGQITTLTNGKADKFTEDGTTYNLETVWKALKPLIAKEAELRTRIGDAESAIDDIEALIGGKLEGKTFKEAVEDLYGKVESINTDLGSHLSRIEALELSLNDPQTGLKAVVADLSSQVEVLNGYKARVEAIEGDYLKAADKTELIGKIDNLKSEIEGKLASLKTDLQNYADEQASDALKGAKTYTDDKVKELTTTITNLSKKVDGIEANLNALNVYVKSVLRGLVFQMQSFYAGVEATDITVLNYRKYTLPAADADTPEDRGYTGNTAWITTPSTNGDTVHHYVITDKETRYQHKDTTRVLTFQAKYYMNPSNAAIDGTNNLNVVAFDRPYHSGLNSEGALIGDPAIYTNEFNGKTTTYAANITPLSWEAKDGILTVNYDAKNPNAIRTIRNNAAVTMFATQVAVNKEGTDTLITSDFATLYKKEVKDIRLSHTPSTSTAGIHNGVNYGTHHKDSVNSHCGQCAYNHPNAAVKAEYAAGLHLMQTVAEAAGSGAHGSKKDNMFHCQDSVNWNDSIDLSKLVEVHYTTVGGDHTLLNKEDAAYNGLHFKYELTGLYYGGNVTSESAHAAIKDSLLRPQMPDSVLIGGVWEGKPAAWDNGGKVKGVVGKQDRQTIGRTPLVRVSLLDKDNNVIDYGYIRIRITEAPEDGPAPVLPKTYTYNAGPMTAAEAWCGTPTASPFKFAQKWIQMEYDIHHNLGIKQAEFETHFTADAAGGEFQQYYSTGGEYKIVATSPSVNEKLGTIRYRRESADEETTVIEWDVTAAQLLTYLQHCGATKPTSVTRIVKFASDGFKNLPDVYVAITASPLTVAAPKKPAGTVLDWDKRKNANYWYAKDSHVERSGLVEIHTNVYGVEDAKENQAETFAQTIQATFVGNKIVDITSETDVNKFIKVANAPADSANNIHFALKFVQGANKTFKGILDGKEYQFVTKLADNGRMLKVFRDDDKDGEKDATEPEDNVAKLVYSDANDSLNYVDVQYVHTDFAEALLNYKAHNALADDVLTAYVTVTARYKDCPFPVTCDPINVRFLRPINVASNDKEVEDAATSQKQIIYLRDLVKLTDWRDEPFKTNYWYYYNIKSIEVVGVTDGGTLDENEAILTNMNQAVDSEPATSLKAVSSLVEFKYVAGTPTLAANTMPAEDAYGRIEYTNLGSTVQKFKVRVPIKVVYQWGGAIAPATGAGAIFTTVDINVKKTKSNARQK